MALQKSIVSLPMKRGIDGEQAPALVDGSMLLQATNAVFDKGSNGELHKRNGYAGLNMKDSAGYAITDVTTLGTFNDEILCSGFTANVTLPQQSLFGYGDVDGAWNWRGSIPQITPTERIIANQGISITESDMASVGGLTAFAWLGGSNGTSVFAKVIDEETGSAYWANLNTSLGALTAVAVRLLAGTDGATLFLLVLTSAGSVAVFTVSTASPGTGFVLQATLATAITSSNFDACTTANSYIVIVGQTAAQTVTAFSVSQAALGGTLNSLAVTTGTNVGATVCCAPQGGTQAMVAWTIAVGGGYNIQAAYLTISGAAPTAGATISVSTLFAVVPPRMGCCSWDSATQVMVYEIAGVANTQTTGAFAPYTTQPKTGWVYLKTSGTATNNYVVTSTVNLASAPFVQDGIPYAFGIYPSQTQQELLLLTPFVKEAPTSQHVVGKFMVGAAGPAPTVAPLLRAQRMTAEDPSGNTWAIGTLEAISEVSFGGQLKPVYGIAELSLDFASTPGGLPGRIPNTQLGGANVFAAGAQVYGYDGQQVSELGFNVFPEPPAVTFQTSQLAIIVDALDPKLATATAVSIYIPDNAANPGGPVGQLITPGEYFVFNAYSGGLLGEVCFYFTVNGVGSAPSWVAGAGAAAVQIPVSSSSTAAEVAAATLQSVSTGLITAGGDWTVAYTPTGVGSGSYSFQRVTCVLTAPAVACSVPTMNRAFGVNQLQAGAIGTFESVIGISCCPASLITGGQYFTFALLDTAPVAGYVWFKVAGVGVDPAPFLPSGTIAGVTYVGPVPVVLAGNEDEVGVARAIAAALNAEYFMSDSNLVQTGNQIVINSTVNGNIPVSAYSANPANVGVAQGYCGTVVDNVSGYVAIEFEATYEWWDGQGQLNQSAPSVPTVVYVPVYVAVGGGGIIAAGAPTPPSAVFTVGVQNLALTQKELNGSKVGLAIYQTQSDQDVFYRITNPTSPLLNVATSTTATTFTANQPDSPTGPVGSSPTSGISSNQPLYTTGGYLEYDTPPAASIVCNHADRIWLAGLEFGNQLAYFIPWSQGKALAYGAQLQTINSNIGQTACGAVVGLVSMDSNLIVLQENAVQYIAGTGPDATGSGQPFALAQLVASSTVVGCRDAGSIGLTPNGIMFKSAQGWYLLDRNLALHPIGKRVQQYNADVCTSCVAVPNSTQMRCLCGATGTTLVYDWFYDDWAPFTNHSGWDACVDPNGVYAYVNSTTGIVQTETAGQFADPFGAGGGNTQGIPMSVTTAWLKLNGIQGFGALFWIYVKGYFLGSQPYLVQIAYNYNPTVVDSFIYQPGASDSNLYWGSDTTWGESSPWGIRGNVDSFGNTFQFRINPSVHHCESLQITITEQTPYSTTSTWSLDAIDLEVGLRRGGFKNIGPPQSIG